MRLYEITGQFPELKALNEKSSSTEHLAKEQQTALVAVRAEMEEVKSENAGESLVIHTHNLKPKASPKIGLTVLNIQSHNPPVSLSERMLSLSHLLLI